MNAVLKTLRWPSGDRDRKRLALWTAAEIAEATGGTASGAFQASGVEMDSRDVRSGDLFFALKGETSDGHLYVDKARGDPLAGGPGEILQCPRGIPDEHVRLRDRRLDHRRGGAVGHRLVDVQVPVAGLALEREEQVA